MVIDKALAMKVWEAVYGDKETAVDCFGAHMVKSAYSDKPVLMVSPTDGKTYDYSWTLNRIRPASTFDDPRKADNLNNLEPMMRLSAYEKDHSTYPEFTIRGAKYKVVETYGYDGYGIQDEWNRRIDWKGVQKRMFVD